MIAFSIACYCHSRFIAFEMESEVMCHFFKLHMESVFVSKFNNHDSAKEVTWSQPEQSIIYLIIIIQRKLINLPPSQSIWLFWFDAIEKL